MGPDSGPVFIVLFFLFAAAATLMWSLMLRYRRRELAHREWLAALEKGLPLPDLAHHESAGAGAPRIYLLRGMQWLFGGVALTVFLLSLWLSTWEARPLWRRMEDAERLKTLGYTQEQIKARVLPDAIPEPQFPLGLCFIGLIPAAVGVAYLAFYRLEAGSIS